MFDKHVKSLWTIFGRTLNEPNGSLAAVEMVGLAKRFREGIGHCSTLPVL